MSLDPQSQHMLDEAAKAGAPRFCDGPVEQARQMFAAMSSMLEPGSASVTVSDSVLPGSEHGVAIREIVPGTESLGTVLYLHGGGWVIGGLDAHTPLCRDLAAVSGSRVIMLDYRIAPEHPFPAAVEDTDRAVEWLHASRPIYGPIAIAGDSAGGNLAAVAARHARDKGIDLALQVLLYPVTDSRNDTASYRENGEGYMLTKDDMAWFWDHYLPSAGARGNPDASPLRADDLTGVAPALIAVSGYDPVRDDGIAYAQRLRDFGVEVALHRHDDQMHGFAIMIGVLDIARENVTHVGGAIRESFRTNPTKTQLEKGQ